jgi:hypothetical protein
MADREPVGAAKHLFFVRHLEAEPLVEANADGLSVAR